MTVPNRDQYPIPTPAHDLRFSSSLVGLVADTLQSYGYPLIRAEVDRAALAAALFGFLHTLRPCDDGFGYSRAPDHAERVDPAAGV